MHEIFWNALAGTPTSCCRSTTTLRAQRHRLLAARRPPGRDAPAIAAGRRGARRLRDLRRARRAAGRRRGLHRGPRARATGCASSTTWPGSGPREQGIDAARVRRLLGGGRVRACRPGREPQVLMADFRADPAGAPLHDALGQDRDLLRGDRRLRLRRLPRPPGLARARGVARRAAGGALPAAPGVQPAGDPAAQPVRPRRRTARRRKVGGREALRIHPDDAAARGIADGRRRAGLQRPRRLPRRGARDRGRDAAAWSSCRPAPGTTRSSRACPARSSVHGNPNVLTLDKGTSRLAQAPVAHSCLVEVERFAGEAPRVAAFDPPPGVKA